MRLLAVALTSAFLLSGCWFGGADLYSGYSTSFGTYVSNPGVNAICLSPSLRLAIWKFETHFGRKIVMNSGYRDPFHNASVGGADDSYHTKCMAADFFIPGVDKRKLIAFAMREPLVGGLGCYPGRNFIHVDVRARPRGWRQPVTFSGC
ncbi:MAG: D-Ala-D-Ala carboxypeptidase family metallohydrolase [Devosia sp.]